jgi:hypothetical protein
VALGGGCCQFERDITEYLESTKELYKDLICVAKDEETNEIKPMSHVFEVKQVTHTKSDSKDLMEEHI